MDNHDTIYCKECGNKVNGTVCNRCGAQIKPKNDDDEFVSLKGSGWQPNMVGYLFSNDFDVWYEGIRTSLFILGVINTLYSPFGIIFLGIVLLIYIFKSINLIILFSSIWLITALIQLYVEISNLNNFFWLLTIFNVLIGCYMLFKLNSFRKIAKQNPKQKEVNIDADKPIDNLWFLVAIMIPGGILGGLYYAWKGRKGSWAVVIVGTITWVLITLILYVSNGFMI